MESGVRYARNGDISIAYETFGDPAAGEPLLLIVGLDFQMVWWPDGFCDLLVAAGFAVVRFDHRDTGLSTHVPPVAGDRSWKARLGRAGGAAYTGLDLLDDALTVMDAVGWRRAHVMGASLGAGLAQGLALLHPDRVGALVSCLGLPADAGTARMLSYLKLGALGRLEKLPSGGSAEQEIDNRLAVYRAIASPDYPFPQEWARRVARISHERSPRDAAALERHLTALRAQKVPPLSTITVPTLVVSGEADRSSR